MDRELSEQEIVRRESLQKLIAKETDSEKKEEWKVKIFGFTAKNKIVQMQFFFG